MTPPSRIVICGAGAIGASVAYFLARPTRTLIAHDAFAAGMAGLGPNPAH